MVVWWIVVHKLWRRPWSQITRRQAALRPLSHRHLCPAAAVSVRTDSGASPGDRFCVWDYRGADDRVCDVPISPVAGASLYLCHARASGVRGRFGDKPAVCPAPRHRRPGLSLRASVNAPTRQTRFGNVPLSLLRAGAPATRNRISCSVRPRAPDGLRGHGEAENSGSRRAREGGRERRWPRRAREEPARVWPGIIRLSRAASQGGRSAAFGWMNRSLVSPRE